MKDSRSQTIMSKLNNLRYGLVDPEPEWMNSLPTVESDPFWDLKSRSGYEGYHVRPISVFTAIPKQS